MKTHQQHGLFHLRHRRRQVGHHPRRRHRKHPLIGREPNPPTPQPGLLARGFRKATPRIPPAPSLGKQLRMLVMPLIKKMKFSTQFGGYGQVWRDAGENFQSRFAYFGRDVQQDFRIPRDCGRQRFLQWPPAFARTAVVQDF